MEETAKYKLQKPGTNDYVNIETLNGNMDKIEAALTEQEERLATQEKKEVVLPPDFDNLLAWAGCTRVSEEKGTGGYVEKWVDSATKSTTKAERTTTQEATGGYTEVLIFYDDVGGVKEKYTIRTTKEGAKEVYNEAVTKEATA